MALSDEGITITLNNDLTITNNTVPTTDPDRAKRRELHVNGKAYQHVSTDTTGQWVYRHDPK